MLTVIFFFRAESKSPILSLHYDADSLRSDQIGPVQMLKVTGLAGPYLAEALDLQP